MNYLQNDWEAWLHLAEFATNNHASETTGMSPFFANYRHDPLWQFDLTMSPDEAQEEWDARQAATKMKEIVEHLQAEILRAQHRHQEQADRR